MESVVLWFYAFQLAVLHCWNALSLDIMRSSSVTAFKSTLKIDLSNKCVFYPN